MNLAIDLYCGLGGWAEGFLSEGYDVIGFDIERHDYGRGTYPGQLVLQDVLTLHGSQFRDAAVIVASPPCEEFSYMAMPWKRAKQIFCALMNSLSEDKDFPQGYTGSRTKRELTQLFDACFRIQREACEAAGRHIPLIVENVRGAQPWVGWAKWHYGSYYLWGDVPALMPLTRRTNDFSRTNQGDDFERSMDSAFFSNGQQKRTEEALCLLPGDGIKVGKAAERRWEDRPVKRLRDAIKGTGGCYNSKGSKRKVASAEIAKIPFPLAQHIARVFKESK